MKTIRFATLAFITVFSLHSCSSDDNNSLPVNEEELITTVTLTLTPENGGPSITLTSRDLDGDGPNAPVVTSSGSISAQTTYTGTITLLNELANPTQDISEEVQEEGADHQFFFGATSGLSGTFSYLDADDNGNPIGLLFKFIPAANTQSGNLTVILRHKPNKTAAYVSAGAIANAGGETDLQVVLPVTVE